MHTEPKNEEITCSFLVLYMEPKTKQKLFPKIQKHDLKQSNIQKEVIFLLYPKTLRTKREKNNKDKTHKKITRLNTKALSSSS